MGRGRGRARAASCDEIVVATTTDSDDDEVEALATELGATVVRGPVDDVLTRFLLAARRGRRATGATRIVRLTADCPLLDPGIVASTVCGVVRARPSSTT